VLTRLAISNLATIASLAVELHDGFTVLTGETGAGKSILIDALRLVLGGKGSSDMVRSGADGVTVEATFDISALPEVRETLVELEVPGSDELVLRRTIQQGGRSRLLANDCQLTAARMQELAPLLVNIHGQHDNQMLLDARTHLRFLDSFAGLTDLRERVGGLFREYGALLRERDALRAKAREREQTMAELQQRIDDIQAIGPSADEEAALTQEHAVLSHAEHLLQLMDRLCGNLHDNEDAVVGRLGEAESQLAQAAGIDATLTPLLEQLQPARIQLEDVARSLASYAAGLELDPNRLDAVNARLAELERLKRRYGGSIDAVLATLAECEQTLAGLAAAGEKLEGIDAAVAELAGRLHRESKTLSARRHASAGELAQRIMQQLQELGMPKAHVEVQLQELSNPSGKQPYYSVTGMDNVEFLLTTNPGQTPRPLTRIASGGELSRIMLALKTVLTEADPTPVLIFDEVDAGVSGATAEIVGRKLRGLGRTHQVLCITHLAQIAAQGDRHLRVTKSLAQEQTYTAVEPLAGADQVREVARLISGVEVSAKALASAEELVARAQQQSP